VGLHRADSRTGGSSIGTLENRECWRKRAVERDVLVRTGTRTSGSGAAKHTHIQHATRHEHTDIQHATQHEHTHSTARVRTHTARHEHARIDTACNTAGARTHRYSRQHGTHTMAHHDAVHMHPVSLTSWILLVSLVQHRMEWQAEKPPVATQAVQEDLDGPAIPASTHARVRHAMTCHHAAHYDTHAHGTPQCRTPRHARTGRATM
jgi:hypothetical protein